MSKFDPRSERVKSTYIRIQRQVGAEPLKLSYRTLAALILECVTNTSTHAAVVCGNLSVDQMNLNFI